MDFVVFRFALTNGVQFRCYFGTVIVLDPMMKYLLAILITVLSFSTQAIPEGNILFQKEPSIAKAIATGNMKVIKPRLATNVTIELKGVEKVYNKNQATQVLQNFFNENIPQSFELKHGGRAAKMGSKFNIGMLRTNNGAYRITYLMKDEVSENQIRKIKIVKVVK